MKKLICEQCCAKINNKKYEPKQKIALLDCQKCSVCGNECISSSFMVNCEVSN